MREPSRRDRRVVGLLMLGMAALVGGCGEAEPPHAPYGAKLVLPTRALDRELVGFDRTRSKLFLWRRDHPWFDGGPSEVLTLDLESGEQTSLFDNVLSFTELGSSSDAPMLFLIEALPGADSGTTLTLLYRDGRRLDFDHVLSKVRFTDEYLVFFREAPDRRELWAGPFDGPRLVSGDLYVHDFQFIAPDRLALAAGSLVDGKPEPPGIFVADLASGALTPEFPAEIDDAEWAGPGPAPKLAAAGLELQTTVESLSSLAELGGGCWSATETEAWGAADQRCYLLYFRHMADGPPRAFVGLPDQHREIALPELVPFPTDFATVAPALEFEQFRGNAPLAAWPAVSDVATLWSLAVWDAPNERVANCPLAQPTAFPVPWINWRQDGGAFVHGDDETMILVESGVDGCAELAPSLDGFAVFSPKGSRLAWTDKSELWSARGDGRDAVRRLTDTNVTGAGFKDEDRLLVRRNSQDGEGLILFDFSEASPEQHPLVEQVFDTGVLLGTRFWASGTAYNEQDRTGKLALIDLETYGVEVIAESVASRVIGYPPAPGADSFPFAYQRVGRFASAQDGIWVGRIPNDRIEQP